MEKLVEWVEKGDAPQEMLFSNPPDGGNMTRKVCPWPNTAEYIGGNTNDWSSFVCSA